MHLFLIFLILLFPQYAVLHIVCHECSECTSYEEEKHWIVPLEQMKCDDLTPLQELRNWKPSGSANSVEIKIHDPEWK